MDGQTFLFQLTFGRHQMKISVKYRFQNYHENYSFLTGTIKEKVKVGQEKT